MENFCPSVSFVLVKEVIEVESDSTISRFVFFIGFVALFNHESAFLIRCSVDGACESPQSVGLVTADKGFQIDAYSTVSQSKPGSLKTSQSEVELINLKTRLMISY